MDRSFLGEGHDPMCLALTCCSFPFRRQMLSSGTDSPNKINASLREVRVASPLTFIFSSCQASLRTLSLCLVSKFTMATAQTRIAELASIIAKGTTSLDRYYFSENLAPPSFAASNPLISDLPENLDRIRNAVLGATSELQALLLGPFGLINNYLYDVDFPTHSS